MGRAIVGLDRLVEAAAAVVVVEEDVQTTSMLADRLAHAR